MTDTSRRRVLRGMGTGIIGVGLAGCLGGGNGGGTTTPTGPVETGIVLPHFGLWDTTIGHLVGQEEGFFEDAGLEVSRIDVSGGGGNVRTVVSGDADIGHATGIAALFAAYREGTDVRIVSNEINQSTDMFFYALADSEYDSLDDIEGAKVGFSSPGSSTNMVALSAVDGVEGAEAVSVGGPPDANAALEGGEVDLAWSVPPFFLDGVQAGDYKIVFRGADVPPFDALSIRVNFVGNNVLDTDPDKVASYFRAHKRALDWAYDNLDDAVRIWGETIDNDDYDLLETAVRDGYPRRVLRLGDFKGLDAANQIAVDFDFIDSKLSTDEMNELIDTSPLPGTDGDTYA